MDEEELNYVHLKALCDKGIHDLHDWVESREHTSLVKIINDDTLDFTIGDFEDHWPDRLDGLPCIRGSSISTAYSPAWSEGWDEQRFVDEGAIHLPPTDDYRQDVIAERLDGLSDRFFVHFGTTNQLAGFGAISDAPEGVITPHIHVVEDATFEEVRGAIEQAIDVFESSVYNEGDNVLLEAP